MAAESPFEGERVNAIAAATRLAAKYGMTLKEAARGDTPRPGPAPTIVRWGPERDLAAFVHLSEQFVRADKERRDRAMEDAIARGLDTEPRASERPPLRRSFRGGARRNGPSHARVLLMETSLPLREVADLTGLDIYQVVGMKLKLRAAI